ncbi:MAG: hypothetical protein IPM63_03015 [Acidobacteriota bacterium]|nr:MAG: hypothetical protein IPM63_03015 [Acidobacteriota bacterium]
MALKHLAIPPVTQGDDPNGCWAASLKWWLKAARNYEYEYWEILMMYDQWTYKGEDENYGALSEKGLFKLFNDPRWHLMYTTMKNDKLNASEIGTMLERSPVLVGYYEPKVNGYHMNVIVASAGIEGLATILTVMDPAFEAYQFRSLSYYKKYYSGITLAYSMKAPAEPVYGYQ